MPMFNMNEKLTVVWKTLTELVGIENLKEVKEMMN